MPELLNDRWDELPGRRQEMPGPLMEETLCWTWFALQSAVLHHSQRWLVGGYGET